MWHKLYSIIKPINNNVYSSIRSDSDLLLANISVAELFSAPIWKKRENIITISDVQQKYYGEVSRWAKVFVACCVEFVILTNIKSNGIFHLPITFVSLKWIVKIEVKILYLFFINHDFDLSSLSKNKQTNKQKQIGL